MVIKCKKNNELPQIFQSYFDLIAIIQENVQKVQYIYKQKSLIGCVSTKAWKCYRCNLIFTEETHALLHEDLSRHSVREVQMVKA